MEFVTNTAITAFTVTEEWGGQVFQRFVRIFWKLGSADPVPPVKVVRREYWVGAGDRR